MVWLRGAGRDKCQNKKKSKEKLKKEGKPKDLFLWGVHNLNAAPLKSRRFY
jgi:hypothetical protein